MKRTNTQLEAENTRLNKVLSDMIDDRDGWIRTANKAEQDGKADLNKFIEADEQRAKALDRVNTLEAVVQDKDKLNNELMQTLSDVEEKYNLLRDSEVAMQKTVVEGAHNVGELAKKCDKRGEVIEALELEVLRLNEQLTAYSNKLAEVAKQHDELKHTPTELSGSGAPTYFELQAAVNVKNNTIDSLERHLEKRDQEAVAAQTRYKAIVHALVEALT